MLNRRHLVAGLAAGSDSSPPRRWPGRRRKLPVVASFSILGDFVKEIGGERVAVTTLVGPNGDAHVYSPTPGRRQEHGGGEADRRQRPEIRRLDDPPDQILRRQGARSRPRRPGIAPLEARRTTTTARQGRPRPRPHDDPHAWQSVANAKIYVANIRDALSAADPAGKPALRGQCHRLSGEARHGRCRDQGRRRAHPGRSAQGDHLA